MDKVSEQELHKFQAAGSEQPETAGKTPATSWDRWYVRKAGPAIVEGAADNQDIGPLMAFSPNTTSSVFEPGRVYDVPPFIAGILTAADELNVKAREWAVDNGLVGAADNGRADNRAIPEQKVNLPKRKADLRKWQALYAKIREYVEQGWNAKEIEREMSLHPKDYKNLAYSERKLRDIIAAGEAGLLEKLP